MSNRYRRFGTALGGLAVFAVVIGISFWIWEETSPRHPYVPAYQGTNSADPNYQPGGFKCDPGQIAKLPRARRLDETDRCRQAAEDHRAQQQQLAESARANDMTQWNLQVLFRQARAAAAQSVFTFLAFAAAALAALFAGIAAHQAKRSADADNAALEVTRLAAAEARRDAIEQAKRQSDQLDIAAQTVSAMRETALRAGESNQIARDSAESQLRAYITVEMKGARLNPSEEIEATADIVNRGQTPARDIVVKWAFAIDRRDPRREDIDHLFSCADCPAEDVALMLGPKDFRVINCKSDPFNPQDLDKVFNGNASLCVVGIVEYLDAFGKQRSTRFVHLYDGRIWNADAARFGHYGNDYT